MQKFNKLKVTKCEIAKKRMMQGNASWKISCIEWEERHTFVLNVYFMDLSLFLAIFA
jgi:hypothetical protein